MVSFTVRRFMSRVSFLPFLLSIMLANHLLWLTAIPFAGDPYGAPDEIHHFEVTRFISQTGRMPVFGPDQDLYIRVRPNAEDTIKNRIYGWQALFPSGAYILAGLFIRILPPLEPSGQVFAARLFSVACNICLIYFAYKILYLVFPNDSFLVWGVPVLISTVPQITFVGSYHNPDALTMAATTASMFFGLSLLYEGWTRWTDALFLGLSLGLVTVSKQNGWLASSLFLCLVLLFSSRKFRILVARLPLVVIPPVLTLGSWFLFQHWHYGDILARDVFRTAWSTDRPLAVPYASQGYSIPSFLLNTDWLELTFKSFWGVFGYMSVELHPVLYWIIFLLCVVSLVGLVMGVFRRLKNGSLHLKSKRMQVLSALAIVVVILIIAAMYHSYYNDYQPQGRYLFPVIVPICLLLLLGGRELLPAPRARSIALCSLCAGMSFFNLVCLLVYVVLGTAVPVQVQWFF